ncbi:MAG: N-6 DNA methylase [Flavobacteriaceae bacterium]|nr:N-6 DNA methylase [Flavobacteriaceae bacterium]
MASSYEEFYKEFLKKFKYLATYKHRYEVFRDFVYVSAIALSNAIVMNQEREEEYLQIIKAYKKEDQLGLAELYGTLVLLLNFEPQDVLGQLYMDLEISSKEKGQFFTPKSLSDFMSEIQFGEQLKNLEEPFITISDPACGAGGLILSFAKVMLANKLNPGEKIWVQCVDIDKTAALMCYIQLSLWNIPAEIIVGNSLSLEYREAWYTPSHVLGNWSYKMARYWEKQNLKTSTEENDRSEKIPTRTETSVKPKQFDFGF